MSSPNAHNKLRLPDTVPAAMYLELQEKFNQLGNELRDATMILASMVYKNGGRVEITDEEMVSAPSRASLRMHNDVPAMKLVLELIAEPEDGEGNGGN